MIPAIIYCIIATAIIFTALLAYACVRVGSKPYPTKPGACENKYKGNQ